MPYGAAPLHRAPNGAGVYDCGRTRAGGLRMEGALPGGSAYLEGCTAAGEQLQRRCVCCGATPLPFPPPPPSPSDCRKDFALQCI